MVPSCSPEPGQHIKKQPSKNSNFFRHALHTVQIHISSHPRFWLFIAFLWLQALIISLARTPLPCFADRAAPKPAAQSNPSPSPPYTVDCPSGKIYAYDLPPSLNKDLVIHNCTELDPWNWECGIISNHGYGRAASELRRFLPNDLHKSWYHTNQFTSEIIFHHRVLKHKCLTLNPESATAFYIPLYAGLAVGKYLYTNNTSGRDQQCKTMLRWIKNQTPWKKTNGSDHFMTIGRITWDFRRLTGPGKTWGSSFLNMPSMKKVTRFIVEKNSGDEMDISVPYPTGFHPMTNNTLVDWQKFVRTYNRSNMFTLIKDSISNWAENDFRSHLRNYCKKESIYCSTIDCAVADCLTNSSVILKLLLESEFCLQPKGESFTSRSIFDCMIAGSVPVFFSKETYEQYDWFLPGDRESYSVFIDQEEVRKGKTSVKKKLMSYSKEEIRRKREKVIDTIPRIVYGKPNGGIDSFKDAFDIALDGVLERIKEEKEWADFLL